MTSGSCSVATKRRLGARQHVDAERPVHWGRPVPGTRTNGSPTTVSFCTFSFGLSDQLRSVRVFIVVRIRLEPLKLPFRGRGLDFFLALLGSDGGPLLLNHWASIASGFSSKLAVVEAQMLA